MWIHTLSVPRIRGGARLRYFGVTREVNKATDTRWNGRKRRLYA
ncbi:hypothetical protein P7H22_20745 [Paenibacillus larvae]|nr:hypothetical protein [Paenibacillus larvae]MDT2242293.1 hypothetical protein [Paenibacillus larvae]